MQRHNVTTCQSNIILCDIYYFMLLTCYHASYWHLIVEHSTVCYLLQALLLGDASSQHVGWQVISECSGCVAVVVDRCTARGVQKLKNVKL